MKVQNVSATNMRLSFLSFSRRSRVRDDLLNRLKAGWRDHFIAIERTILHRRWPARSKVPFLVGKWWVVSELVSREIALERFIGTSIVRQIDYSGSWKRVYRGRDAGSVAITLPFLLLSLLFVFHFLGPSRLFLLSSFSLRVLSLTKRNLRRP